MATIFVGRRAEQDGFVNWVASEPREGGPGRAALLIGRAGMGKSALLRRFEQQCLADPGKQWYVQRVELNSNESPSSFLERLLLQTHQLFRGTFLRAGPSDKRLLEGLLKAVPMVGDLLAQLVGAEKRPGWLQFIDYAAALSEALVRSDGRFVLLIDPDGAMESGQADEWLSVGQRLPARVRVMIAQRPDDVIAGHSESQRVFIGAGSRDWLGELDEQAVQQWYQEEVNHDRLAELARNWSEEARRDLPGAAYRHYRGYPVAHDAVMRLLLSSSEQDPLVAQDPLAAIQEWPREVTALMDMLFKCLAGQGTPRVRAALTLQVFSMPTPRDVWVKAAGLAGEELIVALNDARYRHFFVCDADESYAPFHQLFAERIERELAKSPTLLAERTEAAWQVIEPALDENRLATSKPGEFELLAATKVAARFQDADRTIAAVDGVFAAKFRLGLLNAAESDVRLVLDRCEGEEAVQAACYGNLGNVYLTRGDLNEAERLYRKALKIEKKLGRQEGMANVYGGLGNVYLTRGDLGKAEQFCRKSLEISEKLGLLELTANQYGSLGNVYATRGDSGKAEGFYRKGLEIDEKLGRLEGMASDYGSLGIVYRRRGDLDEAEEMHLKSLEISEKLGLLEVTAGEYGNLGNVYKRRGDPGKARDFWVRSVELYRRIGIPHMVQKVQGWIDRLDEAGELGPSTSSGQGRE